MELPWSLTIDSELDLVICQIPEPKYFEDIALTKGVISGNSYF